MKNSLILIGFIFSVLLFLTQNQESPISLLNLTQTQSGKGKESFENANNKPASQSSFTPASNKTSLSTFSSVTPEVVITEVDASKIPFTYQTTHSISVNGIVVDQNNIPLSGAFLEILDTQGNPLFAQLTRSNPLGQVSGAILINSVETLIGLRVTYQKQTTMTSRVTVRRNYNGTIKVVKNIGNIKLPLAVKSDSTGPISNSMDIDSDSDGISDSMDDFPTDPIKTTRIRYPSSQNSIYTVAFETMYPNSGDGDFNDYVVQYFIEEHLNANGEIVTIKGNYQHIARGADSSHILYLRLPENLTGVNFSTAVTDKEGTNRGYDTNYTNAGSALLKTLPIFGTKGGTPVNGVQTISRWNTAWQENSSNYNPGDIARVIINFTNPISRTILSGTNNSGVPPYWLYLSNLTTNREIHFPGKYITSCPSGNPTGWANGQDCYIDKLNSETFVWAIQIPGIFAWPYEGKNIRLPFNNSGKEDKASGVFAYPGFISWVNSSGKDSIDWYLNPNSLRVYPVPTSASSNLLAYLSTGMDLLTSAFVAILLLVSGTVFGLLLKKKNPG